MYRYNHFFTMENHLIAIERLFRMHELILQENTGTPDEFARRMQISRRTLNNMIKRFNDFDVPIKYSRTRLTYYYNQGSERNIPAILHLL